MTLAQEDSKSLPDSHLFTTPLACTSLYGYMESTHDPSLPENDIDIDLSHDLDIDGSVTLRTSLMPFEEDLFDIPDTQVSVFPPVMSFTCTYFTRTHTPYAKEPKKGGHILSWTRTRHETLIRPTKSVSLRKIGLTL